MTPKEKSYLFMICLGIATFIASFTGSYLLLGICFAMAVTGAWKLRRLE